MKPALAASILVLAATAGLSSLSALSAAGSDSVPLPASAAPAARPVPAPKAKAHGIALTGRISRLDKTKMTFAVRDGAGRETALSWTGATKVSGGELKPGAAVTLRYLDKDSKHIATTVRVNAPVPPTATAAAR